MGVLRRIRKAIWLASMLGLRRGPHVTRYFMYRHLGSVGSRLPQRAGRALAIGQSTNLCEVLGLRPTEVVEANYPEHNILSLDMPDASFDYLLSDQVLEHVAGDPQRAVDECSRVLRPGGVAVHTTCFINPIHGGPDDFWRFTPYALSLLHRQWSEVVDVGGWGNPDVWSVIRDGLRYVGVPHAKWHPLHRLATRNDPLWPVVTWIVARK